MWETSTLNKVHFVCMLRLSADFYEEEVPFVLRVFSSIKQRICLRLYAFQERILWWIKPLTTSFVLSTLADLTRGKAELVAENALLRHQLIILRRQVKRPFIARESSFSWYFWPGWFGPGNRPSFLSSQRHFCAGTVSSSVCSGSANRKSTRESRASRPRRSA